MKKHCVSKKIEIEIENLNDEFVAFGAHGLGLQALVLREKAKNHPWILFEDGIGGYTKSAKEGYKDFKCPVNAVAVMTTGAFGELDMPTLVDIRIDIQRAWNNLSTDYKGRILKLFGVENVDYTKVEEVIYAQPIYLDLGDEDKHMQIYKRLLEKHKDAYFKPHPRDELEYKFINKDKIINRDAPAELLKLLGLKPKRVITLFSSAVFYHKEAEIIWYGPILELGDAYGSLEDIFVPNAKF